MSKLNDLKELKIMFSFGRSCLVQIIIVYGKCNPFSNHIFLLYTLVSLYQLENIMTLTISPLSIYIIVASGSTPKGSISLIHHCALIVCLTFVDKGENTQCLIGITPSGEGGTGYCSCVGGGRCGRDS